MKKILVVGSSNTDLIIRVPGIPRPGETLLGREFQTVQGGKGANQAVAAARAGGEVVFVAAVGDDPYGSEAVKGYQSDRIDTRHIKVCENIPTGVAMITVSDQGENAIAVAPGANARLEPEDLEKAKEAFQNAGSLLVQLEISLETVWKAVTLGKKSGIRVILNPAPARPLPDQLLEGVDLITPNQTEAGALTGIDVYGEEGARKAAEYLHGKGVGTVIVTLGAMGAYLSDPASGTYRMIHGFRVEAVDTTAAGDVFNGQLAVALNEGRSLEGSILLAHAAAALSVRKMGAQRSIPIRDETESFLEDQLKKRTI